MAPTKIPVEFARRLQQFAEKTKETHQKVLEKANAGDCPAAFEGLLSLIGDLSKDILQLFQQNYEAQDEPQNVQVLSSESEHDQDESYQVESSASASSTIKSIIEKGICTRTRLKSARKETKTSKNETKPVQNGVEPSKKDAEVVKRMLRERFVTILSVDEPSPSIVSAPKRPKIERNKTMDCQTIVELPSSSHGRKRKCPRALQDYVLYAEDTEDGASTAQNSPCRPKKKSGMVSNECSTQTHSLECESYLNSSDNDGIVFLDEIFTNTVENETRHNDANDSSLQEIVSSHTNDFGLIELEVATDEEPLEIITLISNDATSNLLENSNTGMVVSHVRNGEIVLLPNIAAAPYLDDPSYGQMILSPPSEISHDKTVVPLGRNGQEATRIVLLPEEDQSNGPTITSPPYKDDDYYSDSSEEIVCLVQEHNYCDSLCRQMHLCVWDNKHTSTSAESSGDEEELLTNTETLKRNKCKSLTRRERKDEAGSPSRSDEVRISLRREGRKYEAGSLTSSKEVPWSRSTEVRNNEAGSSTSQEVGTSTSQEEVGTSTSQEEVGTSTSQEEVGTSTSQEEVGTSTSKEEVGTSTSKEEVGTSTSKEVGTSTSKEEAETSTNEEEARKYEPRSSRSKEEARKYEAGSSTSKEVRKNKDESSSSREEETEFVNDIKPLKIITEDIGQIHVLWKVMRDFIPDKKVISLEIPVNHTSRKEVLALAKLCSLNYRVSSKFIMLSKNKSTKPLTVKHLDMVIHTHKPF